MLLPIGSLSPEGIKRLEPLQSTKDSVPGSLAGRPFWAIQGLVSTERAGSSFPAGFERVVHPDCRRETVVKVLVHASSKSRTRR
jgi:hypothetical protein